MSFGDQSHQQQECSHCRPSISPREKAIWWQLSEKLSWVGRLWPWQIDTQYLRVFWHAPRHQQISMLLYDPKGFSQNNTLWTHERLLSHYPHWQAFKALWGEGHHWSGQPLLHKIPTWLGNVLHQAWHQSNQDKWRDLQKTKIDQCKNKMSGFSIADDKKAQLFKNTLWT